VNPHSARLRREWAVYNPSRDRYPEMLAATDAYNRLIAHLSNSSRGGNMDLLLGFTVLAFHRHDDIVLVGHRWVTEAALRNLVRFLQSQLRHPATNLKLSVLLPFFCQRLWPHYA